VFLSALGLRYHVHFLACPANLSNLRYFWQRHNARSHTHPLYLKAVEFFVAWASARGLRWLRRRQHVDILIIKQQIATQVSQEPNTDLVKGGWRIDTTDAQSKWFFVYGAFTWWTRIDEVPAILSQLTQTFVYAWTTTWWVYEPVTSASALKVEDYLVKTRNLFDQTIAFEDKH